MREIPPHTFINFASQKAKSGAHNPHFWAVASIMAFLILFYNASYLGIASWFPWFADVVMAQGFYAFVPVFLFLVPLIYASLVFRLRGFMVTWAIFVVAVLPRTLQQSPSLESLMRVALFALVALLLGLLVALVYNPEAKEDALKLTKGGRRISLARVLKVQEYERQHVSRELHDKIIQTLLVIANRAHALGAGDSGELTPEAKKQADIVYKEAKTLAVDKATKEVADKAYKEALKEAEKVRDAIKNEVWVVWHASYEKRAEDLAKAVANAEERVNRAEKAYEEAKNQAGQAYEEATKPAVDKEAKKEASEAYKEALRQAEEVRREAQK